MTEVQAAEVIGIVMSDQRLNVLREVLKVIDDERRTVHDTEMNDELHDLMIESLDGLELKVEVMMKRFG